jgi:hypothetical protein
MNAYTALKSRHQQEVNDFPMFFAFSDEKFAEGMKKLGLNPEDTDKIVSLKGTGGFFRKSDDSKLGEIFARHKRERDEAIAADKTGKGYIYQMFRFELANHEFDYTEELDDTLLALGLTMEDIEKSKPLKRGLEMAKKAVRKESVLN